ncbi:MAG: 30S ribosomal protein S12 methylthiotransferase RimO [Fibrobacteria bacterium]|nr:30S ribosomal protein S12 methylthiotransferase RimO [Fibrobacteria bacterium]
MGENTNKKTVYLLSLGCAKNQVDSEHILAEALSLGYHKVAAACEAGLIIINTCGFIESAKQESINEILEHGQFKTQGQQLIVAGCLSQKYTEALKTEIPEADFFTGVYQPGNMRRLILEKIHKEQTSHISNCEPELFSNRVFIDEKSHHAFLKVSEGCNRSCGFCAIPGIRGKQRSRTINDIVKEACTLQSKGVQEVSLIAQDLSAYGTDLGSVKGQFLPELLRALIADTDISWIRLMYAYPDNIADELLDIISNEKRVCNYLDMPVQHASTNVLKLMRRGYDNQGLRDLLMRIRKAVPDISLRTTLLLGHPGETEDDFTSLIDFIEEMRFERLGGFIYSEEEDTWAAKKLHGMNVTQNIAQERLNRVMEIQQDISFELNQQKVGCSLDVIIDEQLTSGGEFQYVGRTMADAPEVDNAVYIKGTGLKPGGIIPVTIKNAWEFDLEGKATSLE